MSLVGCRYIEASDPGAVGAGYQWLSSTTGDLYERDLDNNTWILIGNISSDNYGLLPLTGGSMSGTIEGVTGWAPVDSPNFTTIAKLAGINLATVNDLASLQSDLETMISALVTSSVASSSSTVSIGNNFVMAFGTAGPAAAKDDPIAISAPIFNDGIAASPAQCQSIILPVNITAGSGREFTQVNSLSWICNNTSDASIAFYYLVLATR